MENVFNNLVSFPSKMEVRGVYVSFNRRYLLKMRGSQEQAGTDINKPVITHTPSICAGSRE